MSDIPNEGKVNVRYCNYRGEIAWRRIIPLRIFFGSNQWHPEKQWLMEVMDLAKGEKREFAVKDIMGWEAAP